MQDKNEVDGPRRLASAKQGEQLGKRRVQAGDMVRPVSTMNGRRPNTTTR